MRIGHASQADEARIVATDLDPKEYSFRYYGAEDGLTNAAVKVLFQDRTGFVWAGTENGVFRYDGQRFQRYGPAEGLPHDIVLSLGETPDGHVRAGYRSGLYLGSTVACDGILAASEDLADFSRSV